MESVEYKISDTDKNDFTDAFDNCWALLKINNYYINKKKSDTISWRSNEVSHEMYKCMLDIVKKMSITRVPELKYSETLKEENKTLDETDQTLNKNLDVIIDGDTKDQHQDNNHLTLSSDNTGVSINNTSTIIQDPVVTLPDVYYEKNINKKRSRSFVNHAVKEYVIKLALENPNWTLVDLKKHSGCDNIYSRATLHAWLKTLQKNGKLNDDNTKQLIEKNKLLKRQNCDYIPYDLKKKIIEISRQNPNWSIATLRNQTGFLNINFHRIEKWEKDELSIDDTIRINNLVYAKCLEFKKNNGKLTNELLRQWYNEAKDLYDIKLSPNVRRWLYYFKNEYGIIGNFNDLELLSIRQDNDDGRLHDATDGPLDMDIEDNNNIDETFVDKIPDTSIKISDALSSLQMILPSSTD